MKMLNFCQILLFFFNTALALDIWTKEKMIFHISDPEKKAKEFLNKKLGFKTEKLKAVDYICLAIYPNVANISYGLGYKEKEKICNLK